MRRYFQFLSLSVAGLGLSACMGNPLGMTDAEWQRLTPDQQYTARMRQAEIDQADRERRAAEKALRQKQEALQNQKRAAAIKKLYANARYGDVLQCIIRNPIVDYRPGWRKSETVSFSVIKTETRRVPLRSKDGKRTSELWVNYNKDGTTLNLCRRNPVKRGPQQCDRMVALSAEYMAGISHTINLSDLMQGKIKCAYGPGRGAPQRIILQRERTTR